MSEQTPSLPRSATPVTAHVTYRFAASADAVYDAWLSSKHVRLWFAPGLGEVTRAIVDPRVGGMFSFVQRRGLEDVEHTGAYQELQRPIRIVFSWQVKGTNHNSRVSIDIAPKDDGCELNLQHELHPHWESYRERTEESWRKMLSAMERSLTSAA